MLDERFFISTTLEEREVTLVDGSKAVLHFRHLPNTDFERYAMWSKSADEDIAASAAARLISVGLCEPDGKPALTLEQAVRLKRPVMMQMLTALLDVNGYGKSADADIEKLGNV